MQIRQANLSRLDEAALVPLAEIQPTLVLVFAAPRFFQDPSFAAVLGRAFPSARRVGASTAGEISSSGVRDDSIVVTALRLEHSGFAIAATDLRDMEDSADTGRRLAASLLEGAPRAVFLLAPGVAVNGSGIIEGVRAVLGDSVPLTGGLAGDSGAFSRTWTLLDDRVSDRMLVAVGFTGDRLVFSHGSFGGWQSFGPARRATRVSGNVLYELDGEPALAIYKRYLGDYARDLPASGLLFPFAILSDSREDSGLIRTLLGIDEAEGSLTLAGDVPENGYLKLMHASTEALVDGAEAAAQAAGAGFAGDGPGLAILISCIGRKLVMGDRVDEEVEAVAAVFGQTRTLTGFYSYGEISPFLATTECKLHNQTMTITCLGERA